ncbi:MULTISPECIES: hypothetical protein [unclassified Enterococcus]|uniref:hypothetical protein n=1 Tax=unclassified Enterococcus TaxID=2608891 RepID=UPI001CE11E9A|nr:MULTISPECIES: hypothetical protein [unclassified Enterococcus]MCA5014540.1 hypothetical protein [Enterococcus sp. S23]MCA5017793.1 hypothetical protein [Enterococcus sp. S22(2020)]
MTTTNMTPEEVLKYGKRVVLFQKGKGRHKQEYVIEDYRLYQRSYLFIDKRKHIITTNPVEIMDIYDQIERVYSRQTKGVLIARRSGNYESNRKRLLPLKKTGKGMGEVIQGAQLAKRVSPYLDVDNQCDVVKKRAQQRLQKGAC